MKQVLQGFSTALLLAVGAVGLFIVIEVFLR